MTTKPLIPLLAVAPLAGCGSEQSDRAGAGKAVKAKLLVMANAGSDLPATADGLERPVWERVAPLALAELAARD
jgi:hypothetical protein